MFQEMLRTGMPGRKRNQTVPNCIKEWRRYRGLTQDQLGEQAGEALTVRRGRYHSGWTKSHISKMEKVGTGITVDALRGFAIVLRCSVDDLLSNPPDDRERQLAAEAAAAEWASLSPDRRRRLLKVIGILEDPSFDEEQGEEG